jgi:hypothetical protein
LQATLGNQAVSRALRRRQSPWGRRAVGREAAAAPAPGAAAPASAPPAAAGAAAAPPDEKRYSIELVIPHQFMHSAETLSYPNQSEAEAFKAFHKIHGKLGDIIDNHKYLHRMLMENREDHDIVGFWSDTFGGVSMPDYEMWEVPRGTLFEAKLMLEGAEQGRTDTTSAQRYFIDQITEGTWRGHFDPTAGRLQQVATFLQVAANQMGECIERVITYKDGTEAGAQTGITVCKVSIAVLSTAVGGEAFTMARTAGYGIAMSGAAAGGASVITTEAAEIGGQIGEMRYGEREWFDFDYEKIAKVGAKSAVTGFVGAVVGGKMGELVGAGFARYAAPYLTDIGINLNSAGMKMLGGLGANWLTTIGSTPFTTASGVLMDKAMGDKTVKSWGEFFDLTLHETWSGLEMGTFLHMAGATIEHAGGTTTPQGEEAGGGKRSSEAGETAPAPATTEPVTDAAPAGSAARPARNASADAANEQLAATLLAMAAANAHAAPARPAAPGEPTAAPAGTQTPAGEPATAAERATPGAADQPAAASTPEATPSAVELRGGNIAELRAAAKSNPELARSLAAERTVIVNEAKSPVETDFGMKAVDVGSKGTIHNDADMTMIPAEQVGAVGSPRSMAEQVRASTKAAEALTESLRAKLGGDPATVADVNVLSFRGEFARGEPVPGTPAERAGAARLEMELGFATQMREGASAADLRAAFERELAAGPGEEAGPGAEENAAALEHLQDAVAGGEKFVADRAEELAAAEQSDDVAGLPEGQRRAAAVKKVLAAKQERLAELFDEAAGNVAAGKGGGALEIYRMQAEIRWFAEGAYVVRASYEQVVRFGQARRGESPGGGAPVSKPADLMENMGDEARGDANADRGGDYAGAAAEQSAMAGHASNAKDALKYTARAFDMLAKATGSPIVEPVEVVAAIDVMRQGKWIEGMGDAWGDGGPSPSAAQAGMAAWARAKGYGALEPARLAELEPQFVGEMQSAAADVARDLMIRHAQDTALQPPTGDGPAPASAPPPRSEPAETPAPDDDFDAKWDQASRARDEQELAESRRSDGPVAERFDTAEAAIGEVQGEAIVVDKVRTENDGLRNQGFTETWYVVDSNGEQWTVAHNPRTGEFTAGHRSSSN